MTTAHDTLAFPPRLGRMTPGKLVWALGLTQIVGYGTLYYAFSVLAPAMARDLAWSVEWIYGAFSVALLIGGLAAPWAGRLIDRRGAGTALVWGSAAVAISLALTALAPERISFVAGLIAIEAFSTLVLYDAAFAALVQVAPATSKRDIARLTLIGGFASTLFWPATATLHAHFSWREIYLVFALLNLLICLPVHFWIARCQQRSEAAELQTEYAGAAETAQPLQGRRRTVALILVVAGFCLSGFVLSALLMHMPPVLAALGHGASAAAIGMVFGPAQVLGRLGTMLLGKDVTPVALAVFSSALLPVSVLVLLFGGSGLVAAILFATLLGLGSGLVSIIRGTVPLALFGREGYGERLGQITAVRLVVTSVAPFLFALSIEWVGMRHALAMATAIGIFGVLAFLWASRLARFGDRTPSMDSRLAR
jgi:predicted MFS family arabinose efflux permease